MRSLYTSNTILTSFTYIHTENRLLCKYSQGTTAMSYERRVLSRICNRIPPETEEGSGGAPVVSAVLRKLALAANRRVSSEVTGAHKFSKRKTVS